MRIRDARDRMLAALDGVPELNGRVLTADRGSQSDAVFVAVETHEGRGGVVTAALTALIVWNPRDGDWITVFENAYDAIAEADGLTVVPGSVVIAQAENTRVRIEITATTGIWLSTRGVEG